MERHRQETFFDVNDQPTQNWCWIVEQKFSREMLDAMGRDPTIPAAWEIGKCPSHFRTEARAIERAEGLSPYALFTDCHRSVTLCACVLVEVCIMRIRTAADLGAGVFPISSLRELADNMLADPREVSIRPYGWDSRIEWDTHVVMASGNVVGFTNGPLS